MDKVIDIILWLFGACIALLALAKAWHWAHEKTREMGLRRLRRRLTLWPPLCFSWHTIAQLNGWSLQAPRRPASEASHDS